MTRVRAKERVLRSELWSMSAEYCEGRSVMLNRVRNVQSISEGRFASSGVFEVSVEICQA